MEKNEALLKHFATSLRGRAIGTQKVPSINNNLAKYFSRRELIEIIKNRFDGTIPKEHNLVELENSELLALVGDDMFIISYMTEHWSKEISFEQPKRNTPPILEKKSSNSTKKNQPSEASSK